MCTSTPDYEETETATAPEPPESSAADEQGTPEVETPSSRTTKKKGRNALTITKSTGTTSGSTGLNISN